MNRFAPLVLAGLAAAPAFAAETPPVPKFVLKAGQELTFSVTVVDGKATAEAPKLGKLGSAHPKDGEIVVGLTPRDKDLYSQLQIEEKTAAPIDFIATGHIGEIVIDEREVCGRLGAPFAQRIGGTSWTVVLREFSVGKGTCPAPVE